MVTFGSARLKLQREGIYSVAQRNLQSEGAYLVARPLNLVEEIFSAARIRNNQNMQQTVRCLKVTKQPQQSGGNLLGTGQYLWGPGYWYVHDHYLAAHASGITGVNYAQYPAATTTETCRTAGFRMYHIFRRVTSPMIAE